MSKKTKAVGRERPKLIENLARHSHFSKTEVHRLLLMFHEITPATQKGMNRTQSHDCLHHKFEMTDELMCDRVMRVFDKDNDNYINEHEWIKGMSIYLRGTLEEKIKFCFEIYDLNGDGYITRDEMIHLLKNSLPKVTGDEDLDEGVKDLVDTHLKKLDEDKDGRVSEKDWKEAVYKDNCLLQSLGPCLPKEKKIVEVSALISDVKPEGGMSKFRHRKNMKA